MPALSLPLRVGNLNAHLGGARLGVDGGRHFDHPAFERAPG